MIIINGDFLCRNLTGIERFAFETCKHLDNLIDKNQIGIYIPKNAKYDYFINAPIIAHMQNVENVIDDGNGKIITAFYKSEKEQKNNTV